MYSYKYIFLLLAGTLLYSCGDDEMPTPPTPPELITTLILTVENDSSSVEFKFEDLDGDGGMDGTTTSAPLKAGQTFSASLRLLNASVNPEENITEEIEEEDLDHQFFFSNDAGITIMYDDADSEGNPIGLKTLWSDLTVGTGELTITLKHEPEKTASGVSDGDITNAGGETDIQVTFPIVIE